jgi:PTH1 family peptidyl-tRNA hydrolase
VGEAARFYKLELGDVVVFHDELDLAPGKVRVKTGGGVAGHNGLKSLSAHIGNDYVRVRIGIGHPGRKDRVTGHVLHDFSKADHDWLEPLLGAIAAEAPYLAEGANDKFQSRLAHAMQAEAAEEPSPRGKPASRRKEAASPSKTEKPAEGTLAERLRRWFGS